MHAEIKTDPTKVAEEAEIDAMAASLRSISNQQMSQITSAQLQATSTQVSDADIVPSIGEFGWATDIKDAPLPYFRRNDIEYVARRMVVEKVLKPVTCNAVGTEGIFCWKSDTVAIDEDEANLLNRINKEHCDGMFGDYIYKQGDFAYTLSDLRHLLEFIRTCEKIIAGSNETNDHCGFIQIDSENVVPFVWDDSKQFAPLVYFDDQNNCLANKAKELTDAKKLSYLQFCCKVQKIKPCHYDKKSISVIDLNEVKELFPSSTKFESHCPKDINEAVLPLNRQKKVYPSATSRSQPKTTVASNATHTPAGIQTATNSMNSGPTQAMTFNTTTTAPGNITASVNNSLTYSTPTNISLSAASYFASFTIRNGTPVEHNTIASQGQSFVSATTSSTTPHTNSSTIENHTPLLHSQAQNFATNVSRNTSVPVASNSSLSLSYTSQNIAIPRTSPSLQYQTSNSISNATVSHQQAVHSNGSSLAQMYNPLPIQNTAAPRTSPNAQSQQQYPSSISLTSSVIPNSNISGTTAKRGRPRQNESAKRARMSDTVAYQRAVPNLNQFYPQQINNQAAVYQQGPLQTQTTQQVYNEPARANHAVTAGSNGFQAASNNMGPSAHPFPNYGTMNNNINYSSITNTIGAIQSSGSVQDLNSNGIQYSVVLYPLYSENAVVTIKCLEPWSRVRDSYIPLSEIYKAFKKFDGDLVYHAVIREGLKYIHMNEYFKQIWEKSTNEKSLGYCVPFVNENHLKEILNRLRRVLMNERYVTSNS